MMETVRMLECRSNLFPAKFYWRGRVYSVDAVNECKTFIRRQGLSDADYHFWVRSEGNQMHLIHSLHSGQWALKRD